MHDLESSWEVLKQEYQKRLHEKTRQTRSALLRDLSTILRRFRAYQDEGDWLSVLVDGFAQFANQFAVFTVQDGALRLRSERNLSLSPNLLIPAAEGAAFAAALTSKDIVVSLRTAGEIGPALATSVSAPGSSMGKVVLIPVLNGARVVSIVLVVEDSEVELDGLEFVAGTAASVLERHANAKLATQIAPVPAPAPAPAPVLANEQRVDLDRPQWMNLSEDQRALHLRAQRFARVKVAEMQLAHPDAAQAGRKQDNVYLFLKKDIDEARQAFRSQFLQERSMIDYLHLQLVEVAAEGNEEKLGTDYPGHLA